MGQYITLQKQNTFTGDTSTGHVAEVQPLDQVADVSGWGVAFVTLHTLTVTVAAGDTAEIDISTLDTMRTDGLDFPPTGPAGLCAAFSGLTSNQWYKAFIDLTDEPQGAGTVPIENLLGWVLQVDPTSGGGPFSVTDSALVGNGWSAQGYRAQVAAVGDGERPTRNLTVSRSEFLGSAGQAAFSPRPLVGLWARDVDGLLATANAFSGQPYAVRLAAGTRRATLLGNATPGGQVRIDDDVRPFVRWSETLADPRPAEEP